MNEEKVKRVAVVGAGTMGAGIAQVAAAKGGAVDLIDLNREVLDRAVAGIRANFTRLVEKGKMSSSDATAAAARVSARGAIAEIKDADLAIEAVIEDLRVKHRVFTELESTVGPGCLLASNTSSLSIAAIAEVVRDRSRVIGMHFFNPAPLMPLVEIIAAKETSASAAELGLQTVRAWGKVAVLAKDTPGFIVNRIARGFYLESLRLLGEGVAGVDEIDSIMRSLGGFKMGPFELMDLIGIDVNLSVTTSVWEQMGRPARLAPHAIQRSLVEGGSLGRKNGRGFYVQCDGAQLPAYVVDRRSFSVSPLAADSARVFCEQAGAPSATSTEQFVFARVLSAILNEAALALAEGVATAEDIDLAMVKGTNYPKGPLAWAEQIGYRNVRGALRALNQSAGDGRYEPAPLFADAT